MRHFGERDEGEQWRPEDIAQEAPSIRQPHVEDAATIVLAARSSGWPQQVPYRVHPIPLIGMVDVEFSQKCVDSYWNLMPATDG